MFFRKLFIDRRALRFLLVGGTVLLFFIGCASSNPFNKIGRCRNVDEQLSDVKLKKNFDSIADDLCGDECGEKNCAEESIIVPEFADLQTMVPGKAGILMGELMRSSLSTVCRYNIINMKFSKAFTFSDKGLITLAAPSDAGNYVVGTYGAASNKLYIFVRIVSNPDGKIIKMTTKEVKLSCD